MRIVRKIVPQPVGKRAIILDTETNGRDPQEVIELAYSDLATEETFLQRYNPQVGSNHVALAVHHILPHELGGMPPSTEAKIPEDCGYLIGHNIDFDWKALGEPPVKRICTLAIARALYPNLAGHKLGAMLYALCGVSEETRTRLKDAHSALADVGFCRDILQMMLDSVGKLELLRDPEALWEFSEECRIPKVMAFGKHKGMTIEELPYDYVGWILRQKDMDPYVVRAVRRAHGR